MTKVNITSFSQSREEILGSVRGGALDLRDNVGPTDQTPVLLNSPTDGNLLSDLGTSRAGQAELGGISLDTHDLSTGSRRTNVNHENFVLSKLGNLGLLAIGGLDTEQTTKQEVVNFQLGVDSGKASTVTKDETNETISTAQSRIHASTDTNQTTRDGKLKVVVLGKEGHDPREDGTALNLAILVLGDQTGPNLNLVVLLQNTSQDGTTGNTTLQLLDLGTGLVHIEGTNDNHVRGSGEIADGDRNVRNQVFVDSINVVLKLCRDGNDRRAIGDGTTDELQNRLVMLQGTILSHQVHLVLQNDNVAELHDFDGGQVLRSLRLRASFVSGNKEKGSVHDGGTRQHSTHQNIVTGAVDETNFDL